MTKKNNKTKNKKRKFSILRFILLLILIAIFVAGGAVIGIVAASIKSAPKIDPTIILNILNESSVIVDENGNVLEQIRCEENREIVNLDRIPDYLEKAFIAIEDQRFDTHIGIDPKRIIGSFIHNIKVGDLTAHGGSTITQQLVKNVFLHKGKSFDRKIKEAYLAIEMERQLTKDQILEYYLNAIPLGGKEKGVQAAAFAYFSKDVSELTLAESALLAGIAKATFKYKPFEQIKSSEDGNILDEDIVGYIYVSGTKYTCVFNEASVERQKVVLAKMLELGSISEDEYNDALNQDIKSSINPGQKKIEGISSHFTDYVKQQVIKDLMDEYEYTYEEADEYLDTGGLKIYATMDVNIQQTLEDSYNNFGELLTGKDLSNVKTPIVQEWKSFRWTYNGSSGNLDSNYNILNETGHVLYFKKENILDENNNIYLTNDEYEYDELGNLIINSKKFSIYSNFIDVVDCYTIDENKNLISHSLKALNIGENFEVVSQKGTKGSFKISKDYLETKNDLIFNSENGILINKDYFYYDSKGVTQPQSAAIIMDYHTGEIKALVGGRNIEESMSFNRAINATRQPGSIIKPLSVYLPALDNGYTPATIIDDIPRYNKDGNRWPKNWYEGRAIKYRGLTTLRESVEQSVNTNAVTMLEMIGIPLCQEYLAKFNFIDSENPENDNFITREENRAYNDVNLASLALGGLTKGFTPINMTAAYGAIANNGVYVEPICYTKVINSDGKTILDKTPEKNIVVSPQVAFIMKDILRTTVTQGLSHNAKLPSNMNIEVAGKTGTTQDNGDIWFMGFSPYYVGGIWIGNDNSQLRLSEGSGSTARFWGEIMKVVHEELPPAKFEEVEGVVKVPVCTQSGKLPTELCRLDQRGSQIREEYFVIGSEPTEHCDTHVKAEICTESNLLKSPYCCPLDVVQEKVFITRKIPYDPINYPYIKNSNYEVKKQAIVLYDQISDEIQMSQGNLTEADIKQVYGNKIEFANGEISKVNGISVNDLNYSQIIPEDYQYQLPTQVCTWHNQYHWYKWLSEQNSTTGQGIDNQNNDYTDDSTIESDNDNENEDNEDDSNSSSENEENNDMEMITN